MEYNPFAERYSTIQRQVQSTEEEVDEFSRQLVWHSNFNLGAAAEALTASKREAGRIRSAIEGLKVRHNGEEAIEGQLSQHAKLGLDPRRWFSAERIQHAKQRDEARKRLAQLDEDIVEHEAEAAKVLQTSQQRQAQLDKHRALDPLELKAKLHALELRLEQLRPELANLLADKQRVDGLLSAPLLEQRQLNNRLASLEREVNLAESFDKRLSGAGNSYEKAMVHEECSKAFGGEGRPGRVKQNKQRDMPHIPRMLQRNNSQLPRAAG